MSDNSASLRKRPYPGPEKTRDSLLSKLAIKPWLESTPKGVVFTNAHVVDPANSTLLDGLQTVVIRDGKIHSVEPVKSKAISADNQVAALPQSQVDVDGAFICPGLIDCHVHVTAVPGVKTMSEAVRTPEEVIHYRSSYVLKEMLLRGFTTVRDTGGATKPLALAISEGLILGPRLIQCGKAISQTGGHGDFSPGLSGGSGTGCCGGHSASLARVADGVPQVLKATREELKAGADSLTVIKIMVGGGVASETDAIETVQYSAEEIKAITSTCKQMGNRHTTAHAYTVEAIRHAIDNGVKGIEHGNLLDVETAKLYAERNLPLSDPAKDLLHSMAEHGVYLTPTLSCYGIMARAPFEEFLPPDGYVKNEQVMSQGLQALKIAEENGVTVCYGSDLLISMHALQTEEFTVRAEVLPSPAILKHCTTNAAKMLRMTGQIGIISPGAFADILVLNANPLEDVTVLDRPEDHLLAVIKEGRVAMSLVSGLAKHA